MNNSQTVHIGMLNSFNVLTEKATIEQVISSGLAYFAHAPDEESVVESIEFMIFYFKDIEMYEKCAELKEYIEKTFNEDGTYKEKFCDCEYPNIEDYTYKPKCSVCNLRLMR
jgi:hypothetical protein